MEIKCSLCIPKINVGKIKQHLTESEQSFYHIFAGTIKAQKAVWLVGDAFLRDAVLTFQAMKTKAIQKEKPWPYLYANYNLETLVAPIRSLICPLPARIHNLFVKGMNDKELNFHLP